MKFFQAHQPTSCINIYLYTLSPPGHFFFFLKTFFILLPLPPTPNINPGFIYLSTLSYTADQTHT